MIKLLRQFKSRFRKLSPDLSSTVELGNIEVTVIDPINSRCQYYWFGMIGKTIQITLTARDAYLLCSKVEPESQAVLEILRLKLREIFLSDDHFL